MVLGGFPIGGAPIGGGGGTIAGGTSYEFEVPPVGDPTLVERVEPETAGTVNFGTFHSWLIPEPDSPLTIGWIEAIALGVTRCFSGGRQEIPIPGYGLDDDGGCTATFQLVGQNAFTKMPFIKVYYKEYRTIDGSNVAFYEDRMSGIYQNYEMISDGRVYFLDQLDHRDTFVIRWGGHGVNLANQRTGTWITVANGR